jgi:hypothetical protein
MQTKLENVLFCILLVFVWVISLSLYFVSVSTCIYAYILCVGGCCVRVFCGCVVCVCVPMCVSVWVSVCVYVRIKNIRPKRRFAGAN